MPATRPRPAPSRLLSTRETAELLGIGISTLRRNWPSMGLSAYRVGHQLRFRQSEVEAWLEARRIERHAQQVAAGAPPLTGAERAQLAALLSPGKRAGGAA
jgi:excisionase family DNA binding protein